MFNVKTKMVCQECGEALEVTSTQAISNNVGDLQNVIITIKPCKKCLGDVEMIQRKNYHGCTDAYCTVCGG